MRDHRILYAGVVLGVGIAWTVGFAAACRPVDCTETLTCGSPAIDASDPWDASDASDASDAPDASEASDASDASHAWRDATEASADAGQCPSPSACTPAVPTGFLGPVVLFEETSDSGNAPLPPGCPAAYPIDAVDAFNSPVFSPASCSCQCGPVRGGCTMPEVETYTGNQCLQTNPCATVVAGTCTPAGPCFNASGAAQVVSPTTAAGGTCTASVQKTLPAWNPSTDWSMAARACGASAVLTGAGCTGTDLCAPDAPQGSTLCVYRAGDVTCGASYPTKHLVYGSGADSRTCSDSCGCGSPKAVSCSSTVTLWPSSACDRGTVIGTTQSCSTYNFTSTPYVSAVVTASGGMCPPTGSAAPMGSVIGTDPMTFCCAP